MTNFTGRWRCAARRQKRTGCLEFDLRGQHARARRSKHLVTAVRIASPRLAVLACYAIHTGRQRDHAIHAAHRFVGAHAEPGAGRNLAGIGDIGKLGRRAGRTGIEAEACDVWQVPFAAPSRCRCRGRCTLATIVARPPNCSEPAATLPPVRSGSRASTGGSGRAGQPPSGREQPRHSDGTTP
jgi:hypothetical protein